MRFLNTYLVMGLLLMDEATDDGGGGGSNAPDFSSVIPEGFADKPYMSGVDSFDKLFSKLDGAQSLIGKKTIGIPGADASDDEHNKFFEKLRPENPDAYLFEDTELPEQLKRDEQMETKVKGIFHEAGLSPRQAKIVQSKYDGLMKEVYQSQNANTEAENERLDAEFDALTNKVFGTDRENKIETSRQLLEKHAPQSLKEHIASMDNKSLVLLSSVLSEVHANYIAEDRDIDNGGGSAGDDKAPIDQLDEKISAIRQELDKYSTPSMHPKYKELQASLTANYAAKQKLKDAK